MHSATPREAGEDTDPPPLLTYTNPVWPWECADPFVLKHKGEYWCYRTGAAPDGRIFQILHSPDLVHWRPVGGAMLPLAGQFEHYWAPEVSYWQGRFYLYYAAGQGLDFHLRIAVADQPAGPFTDAGLRLTTEPFAIDAHVFLDRDGERYLFYAADFLDHPRVGTGTCVVALPFPDSPAGPVHRVSLAAYDWQVFDPQRAEKGGVKWHTLEGSFVLLHKNRYFQMFSGGNYQNPSYGVAFATSDQILNPLEWHQPIDGVQTKPVLSTLPGRILGPGHNSVVRGPDNRQLFCVYHVIKPQKEFSRILAIDPLEFPGMDLDVLGPTDTPQPAPIQPLTPLPIPFQPSLPPTAQGSHLIQGAGSLQIPTPSDHFLLEATLTPTSGTVFQLALGSTAQLVFDHLAGEMPLHTGPTIQKILFPRAFHYPSAHLLRVEKQGDHLEVSLDEAPLHWSLSSPDPLMNLTVSVSQGLLELAAVQVTPGYEQLFLSPPTQLESEGWILLGKVDWRSGFLTLREGARISHPLECAAGELCVNFQMEKDVPFHLHLAGQTELVVSSQGIRLAGEVHAWPDQPCQANQWHHLRVRSEPGGLWIRLSSQSWIVCPPLAQPLSASIQATSSLCLDMIRLTGITSGTA